MGQADVAIKIPFIFGIIPPAFMVKMFNKMSAKPFNDGGIDQCNKKNPKASHLMGIDRNNDSSDSIGNTKR